MKLTRLNYCIIFLLLGFLVQGQTLSGELKRWHKVTVTFDGPNTSETANPNPFSDYRLDVTFTHQSSNRSYTVPGYFAACGNAENNSCDSGISGGFILHLIKPEHGTGLHPLKAEVM